MKHVENISISPPFHHFFDAGTEVERPPMACRSMIFATGDDSLE